MTEKVTKKGEAFKLFDEGETALSPKVKALKLKGKTRNNYYLRWKEERGIASSDAPLSESKGKGRVISEREMVVPMEEVKENEEEVAGGEEELGEDESETLEPEGDEKAGEPETHKPEGNKKVEPTGGKRPPTMIAGLGHTYAITISTKTVMFYQFAASQLEEELTLGDFFDMCVEDTYQGRGLDLGLVVIGGKDA